LMAMDSDIDRPNSHSRKCAFYASCKGCKCTAKWEESSLMPYIIYPIFVSSSLVFKQS
jgi:hypothetical protein